MHKRKVYKCPSCGAEVPDLPMPVLQHQLSHVKRRPLAGHRQEPPRRGDDEAPAHDDADRS